MGQDGQIVARGLLGLRIAPGQRVRSHLDATIHLYVRLTSIEVDPGYQMRLQAELGDVDFITGDYLAGMWPEPGMNTF